VIQRHFRELCVASALVLVLVTLALFAPAFFGPTQLLALLVNSAPVLLVACGVSLVILCRQIDISIGSQFAVCSVVSALAAAQGWPMPVVILVAILTGMLLGAVNGLFVACLGLPSIVVTLATMVTWREGLRWWREGDFVRDLPRSFQWFGLSQITGQWTVLLVTLAFFLTLVIALRFLSGGRQLYAVGSDAEAARLAGIDPRRVTFAVFVFMGAMAGLAALLNAIRFPDVDPKTGTGLELLAIAAAVLGGIAITGGRGSLCGVLLGVLLLACIAPALVFLQQPPQWERAIQGGIILLAVAADGWRTTRPTSLKRSTLATAKRVPST
jgi:rhamnose transport system permease protein